MFADLTYDLIKTKSKRNKNCKQQSNCWTENNIYKAKNGFNKFLDLPTIRNHTMLWPMSFAVIYLCMLYYTLYEPLRPLNGIWLYCHNPIFGTIDLCVRIRWAIMYTALLSRFCFKDREHCAGKISQKQHAPLLVFNFVLLYCCWTALHFAGSQYRHNIVYDTVSSAKPPIKQ